MAGRSLRARSRRASGPASRCCVATRRRNGCATRWSSRRPAARPPEVATASRNGHVSPPALRGLGRPVWEVHPLRGHGHGAPRAPPSHGRTAARPLLLSGRRSRPAARARTRGPLADRDDLPRPSGSARSRRGPLRRRSGRRDDRGLRLLGARGDAVPQTRHALGGGDRSSGTATRGTGSPLRSWTGATGRTRSSLPATEPASSCSPALPDTDVPSWSIPKRHGDLPFRGGSLLPPRLAFDQRRAVRASFYPARGHVLCWAGPVPHRFAQRRAGKRNDVHDVQHRGRHSGEGWVT